MAVVAAMATVAAAAAAGDPSAPLHRPSPDWRDQVLYFVLTDRFDDGDARNNDQGAGEYDPARRDRYSGGDLAGVTRRLDYIRGLGATGVWLTPWVANQWLDPVGGYAGYHGYWTEHFMRVDRHAGDLAALRTLSRELHRRDMTLVQDVVVNHVGNYFDIAPGAAAPQDAWRARGPVAAAPAQPPFHLNDARRARDRAAAVYHWTPPVTDYDDPVQLLTGQMSGLDDLNTRNPAVRRALRRSFGHWIRAAGVDAFRIDTAFYVEPEFFDDFLHARDAQAPGVLEVARRTGRRDFLVFGEGFAIDRAFEDTQSRRIERYLTREDGRPRLPGMLDFPLYGALNDVFARGRPPAELGWRIQRRQALHARPQLMPTFVDNHDVDRFLAAGDEAGLRQALLAMFTLPGIPVLYYGTEQGLREPRASMFAAGWGSGGRDRFDTGAPLYRHIAALAQLRRTHRAFSRGLPQVLHADAAGAGAIAWHTVHEEHALLVVLNTAAEPALVERLAVPAAAHARLEPLFALDGTAPPAQLDGAGQATLVLPPRSGFVWRVAAGAPAPSGDASAADAPTLDALPAERFAVDVEVGGTAAPGARLQLVVDGRLGGAQPLQADAQGRWRARVDTASMVDPAVAHRVAVHDPARGTASAARPFRVERAWQLLADVEDPAGDDHGPAGRYAYPTDPSWGPHRQLDLRRVRAWGAGGALRLELGMHRITRSWSPANGFDHVAFTVFVELPGEAGGSTVMPLQHGTLPAGMAWHRRLRVHGWSNALFSAAGASADTEGTPAAPAAALAVDAAGHTLQLTLPPAALGGRRDLRGVRVWVTTWDWDGGYRALQATPGGHAFGGGTAGDPLWMDASAVITLP